MRITSVQVRFQGKRYRYLGDESASELRAAIARVGTDGTTLTLRVTSALLPFGGGGRRSLAVTPQNYREFEVFDRTDQSQDGNPTPHKDTGIVLALRNAMSRLRRR